MKRLVAALAVVAPLVVLAQTQPQATPAPVAEAQQPAIPQNSAAAPQNAAAVPENAQRARAPQYAPPPQNPPQYGQPQYAPPAQVPPQYAQPQYAPPPQYPQYGQHPPPYGAPPYPPTAFRPYQRDSWYLGFGVGGGDGSVKLRSSPYAPTGGTRSFGQYFKDITGASPTTVAVNLKAGVTVSPQLLVGLDVTAVRSDVSGRGLSLAFQVTNYDLVATFFPAGRGFFLRGGGGIARFTYDASGSGVSLSDSATGPSLIAGVGYAFWLGQHFNLTVNLDYAHQWYSGKDDIGVLPESSSMWAIWAGFDWY